MQCIITEKQSNQINKERAHGSQIVGAKENLKLSYVGSSQRQAPGIKQRIKALRQGRH